jgi:hypothetical protein
VRIILRLKDDRTATLDDAGLWSSADARLRSYLNILFGTRAIPPSPSAGISPFAEQARRAAAELGGTVEWPNESSGDPSVVY